MFQVRAQNESTHQWPSTKMFQKDTLLVEGFIALETFVQCIFFLEGHRERWPRYTTFDSSPPPRCALLPQPLLHDYTLICRPDATRPVSPLPSLLQLPRSTCGCYSGTLFINSFLMLPDGMTVIYGGLSSELTFVCLCARACVCVSLCIYPLNLCIASRFVYMCNWLEPMEKALS